MLAILTNPRATERERILRSGLPSSTYNVARRRVYAQGWLRDLLVPNPGPCGFAGVELRLARPSRSVREEFLRSWADDPECVLLWAGLHAALGIFMRSGPLGVAERADSDGVPGGTVQIGSGHGSLPVYFDYSGLWARFGGAPAPDGYPAGLDAESRPATRRALASATGLMRTGPADSTDRPRWTNLLRLPRSPRRALEERTVQSRTVLDVFHLPAFRDRRLGEVVLIEGRLRPDATDPRLLNSLTQDCGVFPFLLAASEDRLIMAGVGQTSATGPGRIPVPSARRSVMGTLTDAMDPAEVLIEPVEAIEEIVPHRYPMRLPALGG